MSELPEKIKNLKRKLEDEHKEILKRRLQPAGWIEQKKIREEEAKAQELRDKAEEKRLEAEKQRLEHECDDARKELFDVTVMASIAMDKYLLKNPYLYLTHPILVFGMKDVAPMAVSAIEKIQAQSRFAKVLGKKKNKTSPFDKIKRVVISPDGESCIALDYDSTAFTTLHDYKMRNNYCYNTTATYPLDVPDEAERFNEGDPKYSPSGAFRMVWYILPESGDPFDGIFAITDKMGRKFKRGTYDEDEYGYSDCSDGEDDESYGLGKDGTEFRVLYYHYRPKTLACTSDISEVEVYNEPGEPQWMAAESMPKSKSPMPGFFRDAWDLLTTVTQSTVGPRGDTPRELVELTASCPDKTTGGRAIILSLEMNDARFDRKKIKDEAVGGRSVYCEIKN